MAPHDDYRDGDDPFSSPEVNPFGDDFGSPEGNHIAPDLSPRHRPDPFSSTERPIDSMVRLRTHLLSGRRTYQDVEGSFELLGGIRKIGRGGGGRNELESGVVVIRPKDPGPPEPPKQLRFAWKKAGFTPCSSSCLGKCSGSVAEAGEGG